jgi:hypothetical protein
MSKRRMQIIGGIASVVTPEEQGKITAEKFLAASDTFHLVIEQERGAGRIGRALLDFDLKPGKSSTG